MGCALALASVPAQACRVRLSAEENLRGAYEKGIFSSVAIVTIVEAKHTQPGISDAHPWSATANVDQLLLGSLEPKTLTFERGWGSSACDGGHPLAQPGEKWAVYFWKHPERGQLVWASYPLQAASAADPMVERSLKLDIRR
jgi:hypothetical protein